MALSLYSSENRQVEDSMTNAISLETILNASANGIIVIDIDGSIIFANKQASALVDIPSDKFAGLIIGNVLPAIGTIVSECVETGNPVFGKQIFEKKRNMILSVTPLMENKMVLGSFCSFQEILKFEGIATDLESYKKLNEQLETIFSSSSDGIFLVDGQGIILKMNAASEKINNI
jgi:transcriptional regulator with PAS, ATPase and Fis domain